MRIPLEQCNLIIFDNSVSPMLEKCLREKFDIYKDAFLSARYYKTYRSCGSEILSDPIGGFEDSKLPMIFAMQQDIMKLVKTEKFILLEDDTLAPRNAIPKMLKTLSLRRNVAVVCGIETSRSMIRFQKVRLGVHYMKMQGNKVVERISLPPNLTGLRRVHGCGWYCVASYTKIWKKSLEEIKPFVHTVPRFALDNIQTYLIHKKGYKILADFNIQCVHMQTTPDGIIFWDRSHALPMLDIWLPDYQTYAQSVVLEWKHKLVPKDCIKKS